MVRYLGVCLLLVVGGAAAAEPEPREPEHDGKPLSHWLKELSASDRGQRDRAAQAILAVLKADVPQTEYRRVPTRDYRCCRLSCSQLLSKPEIVKEHGKTLTPLLAGLLRDEDLTTRYRAAQVLAAIGRDAAAATPALRTALEDKNVEVRSQAAVALARVDPKETEPMIVFLLKHPATESWVGRTSVRWSSEPSLAAIGPEAIPFLVPRLAHEDAAIRDRVSQALALMGEPATAAVSKALSAEASALRAGATRCLGRMHGQTPVKLAALKAALKDSEREVRLTAAESLGNLEASAAVPVLIEALAEGRTDQRARAALAIRMQGEPARAAAKEGVAVLENHLQRKDGVLDLDVADALVYLAPSRAKRVAGLLGRRTVTGQNEVQVLDRIGQAAPEVNPALVPALLAILKQPKSGVGQQREAVAALQRMGPAAKAAAPVLIEIAKGNDENLKQLAARVVPFIDPEATDYPRDLQTPPYNPNESVRPTLSVAKAADFLDVAAKDWLRTRSCGECHTHYTYLMVRPFLKTESSLAADTRKFIEAKIEKRSKGRFTGELVTGALALAFDDARTGKLQPLTRQALDRMWSVLPLRSCESESIVVELSPDYSAVLAVVAANIAPEKYAQTEKARNGLAAMRSYLRRHLKPENHTPLHTRALLLWAASHQADLLTGPEREAIIQSLLSAQQKDGGWSLASLERASRHDQAKDVASDGYGTGFTVYVLRQAGVPATRPEIARAVNWLRTNQRASGRWFTPSSSAHQVTSAEFGTRDFYGQSVGTAFALLALQSCNALDAAADQSGQASAK